jgi:hypothetical protein
MTTGTATFIRTLPPVEFDDYFGPGAFSRRSLYKVDVSGEYDNHGPTEQRSGYMVISSVRHAFAHETMAFSSDSEGKITDWLELAGVHGVCPHDEFVRSMGFDIE